jgi:hypothetical protein
MRLNGDDENGQRVTERLGWDVGHNAEWGIHGGCEDGTMRVSYMTRPLHNANVCTITLSNRDTDACGAEQARGRTAVGPEVEDKLAQCMMPNKALL